VRASEAGASKEAQTLAREAQRMSGQLQAEAEFAEEDLKREDARRNKLAEAADRLRKTFTREMENRQRAEELRAALEASETWERDVAREHARAVHAEAMQKLEADRRAEALAEAKHMASAAAVERSRAASAADMKDVRAELAAAVEQQKAEDSARMEALEQQLAEAQAKLAAMSAPEEAAAEATGATGVESPETGDMAQAQLEASQADIREHSRNTVTTITKERDAWKQSSGMRFLRAGSKAQAQAMALQAAAEAAEAVRNANAMVDVANEGVAWAQSSGNRAAAQTAQAAQAAAQKKAAAHTATFDGLVAKLGDVMGLSSLDKAFETRSEGKTLDEATAICAASGAKLCSKTEFVAMFARGEEVPCSWAAGEAVAAFGVSQGVDGTPRGLNVCSHSATGKAAVTCCRA